jgi:hypothetical protein
MDSLHRPEKQTFLEGLARKSPTQRLRLPGIDFVACCARGISSTLCSRGDAAVTKLYNLPARIRVSLSLQLTTENRTKLNHTDIRWNPATREWYCAGCGQTSDHSLREDAELELGYIECTLAAPELNSPKKRRS